MKGSSLISTEPGGKVEILRNQSTDYIVQFARSWLVVWQRVKPFLLGLFPRKRHNWYLLVLKC